MTKAIISDIHGNLPALEAVIAELAKRSHDQTYCLGDLVGYGAFPNEVVERIRSEGSHRVRRGLEAVQSLRVIRVCILLLHPKWILI